MTPLSEQHAETLQKFINEEIEQEEALDKLGGVFAQKGQLLSLPAVTLEQYFQLKLLASSFRPIIDINSSSKEITQLMNDPVKRKQQTDIANLKNALKSFETALDISHWAAEDIFEMYSDLKKMRETITEVEKIETLPQEAQEEIKAIEKELDLFLSDTLEKIDPDFSLLTQINALMENMSGRLQSLDLQLDLQVEPENLNPNISFEENGKTPSSNKILKSLINILKQSVLNIKNLIAKISKKKPEVTTKTDPTTKTDTLSME